MGGPRRRQDGDGPLGLRRRDRGDGPGSRRPCDPRPDRRAGRCGGPATRARTRGGLPGRREHRRAGRGGGGRGPQPGGAPAGRRGIRCRRGPARLAHGGGPGWRRARVGGCRGEGCLGGSGPARPPRTRPPMPSRASTAAPEAGRTKVLTIGGGVTLALVLLVAFAVLLVRRRNGAARRLRASAMAAAGAATPPDDSWPYATLPPDGHPAEPPGRPPSGDEGADPS